MRPSVSRVIPHPSSVVWTLLTHVEAWPEWGPTVRGATVPGGIIRAGSEGTVRPPVGPTLPFTVTDFDEGRLWAWSVAGVPATAHHLRSTPDGCVVTFTVPWWAPLYLPVCAWALHRLHGLAADGWSPGEEPPGPFV